jgi:hypothetical protein
MFKEYRQRRGLRKSLKGLARYYGPQVKAATGSQCEYLNDEWKLESGCYQPELEHLETKALVAKAERYGIEVDYSNEDWFTCSFDVLGSRQFTVLTDHGRVQLRRSIRDEWRNNVEWWGKLVTPILVPIACAVIAAIVAVLMSKHS